MDKISLLDDILFIPNNRIDLRFFVYCMTADIQKQILPCILLLVLIFRDFLLGSESRKFLEF